MGGGELGQRGCDTPANMAGVFLSTLTVCGFQNLLAPLYYRYIHQMRGR